MITDKYRIVEVIKENGKDPKIYDWDMEQYPLGENSWLLVYEKEAGNKEKTPISFLGTRYMATTGNCIRVIHATQTVIINHTCKVFFLDYGNEDEQENMQKGFMFRLSGWLIPKDAIYGFLEIYMENDVNRDDWKTYYRQIDFFDDFEGTGSMLVSLEDL